ncbi:MAG: DMT family transporter [Vicinamibacteria bacterium]|nr:DMT family transporter [Vicinamibacteria bacterium]
MTQRQADLGLVGLTMIWGTTFAVVHEAVSEFPIFAFLALRFGIASLVILPWLARHRADTMRSLGAGAMLGTLLFGGFATQTQGLAWTTPSRAGFITGLSVVLVPVVAMLAGQRPPRRAVLGVILAFIGLTVVSLGCSFPLFGCEVEARTNPTRLAGDLFVLTCAVIFAFHIVAVSHWASRRPVLALNGVQMLVVAMLAATAALFSPRPPLPPPSGVILSAVFLGIIATTLALALWLVFQRHTTSTHAALIFSLEPVFAALFSRVWIGEIVTPAVWIGGALMLAGVLLAETPPPRSMRGFRLARWLSGDPMTR